VHRFTNIEKPINPESFENFRKNKNFFDPNDLRSKTPRFDNKKTQLVAEKIGKITAELDKSSNLINTKKDQNEKEIFISHTQNRATTPRPDVKRNPKMLDGDKITEQKMDIFVKDAQFFATARKEMANTPKKENGSIMTSKKSMLSYNSRNSSQSNKSVSTLSYITGNKPIGIKLSIIERAELDKKARQAAKNKTFSNEDTRIENEGNLPGQVFSPSKSCVFF